MHHATNLVDLAKTPEEVKRDIPTTAAGPGDEKPSVPLYPGGCCLRLEDDELKKLGMAGDLPPAGAEVHGCFIAKVKSSRPPAERIDSDGKKKIEGASVEIEIQKLGFASQDDAERALEESGKRQQTWYGDEEPDGDEAKA